MKFRRTTGALAKVVGPAKAGHLRVIWNLCHLEQRPVGGPNTLVLVQRRLLKWALAAAWILAVGVIGVPADTTSAGTVVRLIAFGLVPPLILLLLWRAPRPMEYHGRG